MEQELDAEWDTPTNPSESGCGHFSWIWNKGVRLGKQILVAGFVASTAPVVLPPLVVVSAIGIAFSLPYGFFLASYACTEKLMDKLLPIPAALPVDCCLISDQEGLDQEEYYYGAGGSRGYLGESDVEEVLDVDKKDNQQMNEAKIGDAMRIEFAKHEEERHFVEREDGRTKPEESESDLQFESEVDIAVSGNNIGSFETLFQVTSSVMVDEFKNQKAECGVKEQKVERDTKVLIEKMRDSGKAQVLESVDQKQGATKQECIKSMVDVDIGEMEEGKQVDEEDERGEQRDAYPPWMESNENSRGRGGRKKSNKYNASERVAGETEFNASSVDRNSISISGKSEVSSKNVEEVHVAHVYGSKTGELETFKGMDIPSAEVIFTNEKLCEKMAALRTIVGYKGTSHVSYSCVEELKSLYAFTGIEPPPSLDESSSDLADITHKLQFLMSIVGVK